jgi:hypothetical protein
MTSRNFQWMVGAVGVAFALAFIGIVVPALMRNPDVFGAFAAGFVNPFASGYALDAISCWLILAMWVVYEARTQGIRHGWMAIVLGIAPGVATGFAFYLILRARQASR